MALCLAHDRNNAHLIPACPLLPPRLLPAASPSTTSPLSTLAVVYNYYKGFCQKWEVKFLYVQNWLAFAKVGGTS